MNKKKELRRLGEKIREIRLRKNMTQLELAARINKDQQSVQRLEAGRINPGYIYLMEIAEGLEIALSELFNS